jgi:hypothetical protein
MLLTEGESERTHVGIAARETNDLVVDGFELVERRIRIAQRGRAVVADQRLEVCERSSSILVASGHLIFHLRHRLIVGFRDVPGLHDENSQRCGLGSAGQRLHTGAILRPCLAGERVERFPEIIDRRLRGREREPLCLQVRVFHSEIQRLVVELLVFGELRFERVKIADVVRVPEPLQDGLERRDIVLELFAGFDGFFGSALRRLVGVGHHGPVRRIGGHRELNADVRPQAARFDLIGQDQSGLGTRAGQRGGQGEHRNRRERRGGQRESRSKSGSSQLSRR